MPTMSIIRRPAPTSAILPSRRQSSTAIRWRLSRSVCAGQLPRSLRSTRTPALMTCSYGLRPGPCPRHEPDRCAG